MGQYTNKSILPTTLHSRPCNGPGRFHFSRTEKNTSEIRSDLILLPLQIVPIQSSLFHHSVDIMIPRLFCGLVLKICRTKEVALGLFMDRVGFIFRGPELRHK